MKVLNEQWFLKFSISDFMSIGPAVLIFHAYRWTGRPN
jgi:hypothetical protein